MISKNVLAGGRNGLMFSLAMRQDQALFPVLDRKEETGHHLTKGECFNIFLH